MNTSNLYSAKSWNEEAGLYLNADMKYHTMQRNREIAIYYIANPRLYCAAAGRPSIHP
jgi:hypothetical protein